MYVLVLHVARKYHNHHQQNISVFLFAIIIVVVLDSSLQQLSQRTCYAGTCMKSVAQTSQTISIHNLHLNVCGERSARYLAHPRQHHQHYHPMMFCMYYACTLVSFYFYE